MPPNQNAYPDVWNLQDGWVIGPYQELLLWIPPIHREGLCDDRIVHLIGKINHVVTVLNFDHFISGSDWTRCREPINALDSHCSTTY